MKLKKQIIWKTKAKGREKSKKANVWGRCDETWASRTSRLQRESEASEKEKKAD